VQKFEYKVEEIPTMESTWSSVDVDQVEYPSTRPLHAFLQEVGEQGWELVSCFKQNKSDSFLVVILKRPQE